MTYYFRTNTTVLGCDSPRSRLSKRFIERAHVSFVTAEADDGLHARPSLFPPSIHVQPVTKNKKNDVGDDGEKKSYSDTSFLPEALLL